MGLGGYILWSALAREYEKTYQRKIYFTNRRFGLLKYPRVTVKSELFANNPHVQEKDHRNEIQADEIRMDNKKAVYWDKVSRQKIVYKKNGHAIEIACAAYGITSPEVSCDLFLSKPEIQIGENIFKDIGPFMTIEPHTKDSFTINKRYEFGRWQRVVNWARKDGIRIVQVGEKGKRIMAGVVDATGRYSIREVASIIKASSLFAGPEGGLMHLANAVGTRSVIVYGGYVSPLLTGYRENINLFSPIECAPCGLRRYCLHDERECMKMISPEAVYENIIEGLRKE